jgi:DNA-binding GntR family transcriptional regulator
MKANGMLRRTGEVNGDGDHSQGQPLELERGWLERERSPDLQQTKLNNASLYFHWELYQKYI